MLMETKKETTSKSRTMAAIAKLKRDKRILIEGRKAGKSFDELEKEGIVFMK